MSADASKSSVVPATSSFGLPELLWRMGFGPLVGQVWMLIGTTGRRSGETRYALAPYFFVNGKKYVYAEPEAQWYQNALDNPHCTIQTAYGTERVIMQKVTEREELTGVLITLMHNRPAFADRLFHKFQVQSIPDDLIAVADRLSLVSFAPTTEATPPSIEIDLIWLVPAVLLGIVLGWRFGRGR